MAQPTNENLLRFADDALPQVVRILECWSAYRDDTTQTELLGEALRLTHRVKGDASMIGLSAFSHVAFLQEETLQEVSDSGGSNDETSGAIEQMIAALHGYIEDLPTEDKDEREALASGVRAYRRAHSLPESDDDSEIARLLFTEQTEQDNSETVTTSAASSAVDSTALDAFREEATDLLQVVADLFTGGDTEEELDEIRRAIHSVKGGAATIGLRQVADLAHAVEDVLDQLCQGSIEFSSEVNATLGQSVDALSDLIEDGKTELNVQALHDKIATISGHRAVGSETVDTNAVVDEAAIDQLAADEIQQDLECEISPELLAIYSEEAEDHIKKLYDGLNELHTSPGNQEALQSIRRSAHTLKGAAGAVGLRVITKLSHRMEDLLDLLYDGEKKVTPDNLTLLLNTTDCLHDLSEDESDHEAIKSTVVSLYKDYEAILGGPETSNEISIPIANNVDELSIETDIPKGAEAKDTDTGRKASSGQVLRVPIDRVDDLVRTVGELIINRTTFEQRMADFVRYVDELAPVLARLRTVSTEMETRHSVEALRGGWSAEEGRYGKKRKSQISGARVAEFDALEFDRYSDFHLTARAIAEATADVSTVSTEFRTLIGDFDSLLARQDRLSRETQDRLMQIRMVPLASLTTRLHRAVRVVATNQNKKVELVIEGENIELDKTVLEELADPLLHLLRNAVDHGVEPSDLRIIKGKPETATIRIRAIYQGTQVVLRISDDGGGLDHSRIAASAIKGGHLSVAESEEMTPQEIFPYIFLPGLTTAEQLSEVSGRGVGMDIVRDKVQKLKGTVGVDSEVDKGTTFTIRLPMTMAVTRALMVKTGGQSFAVPMQAVVQIARLDRSEVDKLGSDPVIRLGDSACPLISLSDHLGLPQIDDDSQMIPILIVRSGDTQIAIRVERILSGRDIVVKTLGKHLRRVRGLIGATLLGDGTVVPILDPNTFAGCEEDDNAARLSPNRRTSSNSRNTTVMIVDDSVSVRRVMENLVKSQGWSAIVAKDGVDALEILRRHNHQPDVFLLDIEMPRMDGYELLSSLRSMDKFSDSPVVMVTSRAGDKHRQKATTLGATGYVVKPYQDDDLVALIEKLTAKEPVVA